MKERKKESEVEEGRSTGDTYEEIRLMKEMKMD